MTNPQAPVPGPGYYDDGQGNRRWWDGAQWTSQIEPVSPPPFVPPAAPAATAVATPALAPREPLQQTRKSNGRVVGIVVTIGVVVVFGIIAAVTIPPIVAAAAPIDVDGSVSVSPGGIGDQGTACARAREAATDIVPGTTVTISDGNGNTLGTGQLDGGREGLASLDCIYSFIINGIPKGEGSYLIKIGERDPQQVTEDELSFLRINLSS